MNPILEAYKTAHGELGVKEVRGGENTRIIEYHASTRLKANEDEVPWCSAFMCWCLERVGIISTKSAAARSYLDWGVEIEEPYEGCVVIFKRGEPPAAHVAFYVKESGDWLFCLGGNQNDKVCVNAYPKSDLLGYREAGPDSRQ